MQVKRKTGPGFTVVELLLVGIVLLVVAALVSPNFSGTFKFFQLKDVASRLSYLMRYAQSSAITQENVYRLEFSGDLSSFWLKQKSQDTDQSGAEEFERIPSRLGKTFKVPTDIKLVSPRQTIDFYTDGTMDKVSVQVCYKEKKCLNVSTEEQSGYIHVFEAATETETEK